MEEPGLCPSSRVPALPFTKGLIFGAAAAQEGTRCFLEGMVCLRVFVPHKEVSELPVLAGRSRDSFLGREGRNGVKEEELCL